MKKVIDDKMDVGMGFGWLLDRFLVGLGDQVGRQVRVKLAPKSYKMGYQDDVKKLIEQRGGRSLRTHPGRLAPGP